jgi:hypothetical protein
MISENTQGGGGSSSESAFPKWNSRKPLFKGITAKLFSSSFPQEKRHDLIVPQVDEEPLCFERARVERLRKKSIGIRLFGMAQRFSRCAEVLYFFLQPLAAEVSFRRKPQPALAVPDSKAAPASSIASPLNC